MPRHPTHFPSWWDWEIELTPHLEKRMEDRRFSEIDLREMMAAASAVVHGALDGRFEVLTQLRGLRWKVIVEPDFETRMIVVVTAYPCE